MPRLLREFYHLLCWTHMRIPNLLAHIQLVQIILTMIDVVLKEENKQCPPHKPNSGIKANFPQRYVKGLVGIQGALQIASIVVKWLKNPKFWILWILVCTIEFSDSVSCLIPWTAKFYLRISKIIRIP